MRSAYQHAIKGLEDIDKSITFFTIKVEQVSSKLTYCDLTGEEYKRILKKAKEVLIYSLGFDIERINESKHLKEKKEIYLGIFERKLNSIEFKLHFDLEFEEKLREIINEARD